jgi:hypothetical protein
LYVLAAYGFEPVQSYGLADQHSNAAAGGCHSCVWSRSRTASDVDRSSRADFQLAVCLSGAVAWRQLEMLAQGGFSCSGRRYSTARRLQLVGVFTRCPAHPSRIWCPSPSQSYFLDSCCFLRRGGAGGLHDASTQRQSPTPSREPCCRPRRAGQVVALISSSI